MNVNIVVGCNETNYNYLNLISENGFASFVNIDMLNEQYNHSCLDHIFITLD